MRKTLLLSGLAVGVLGLVCLGQTVPAKPPMTRPMPFRFEPANPWPGGGNPFAQPHLVRPPTTQPFRGPIPIPWGGDPHIFTSPPSTQPTIPPGSRSFQFNGGPVYIIPLNLNSSERSQTTSQAPDRSAPVAPDRQSFPSPRR